MSDKMPKKGRRRWGDRQDGRLLRSIDPMARVSPFIMPTRSGAQNYFQDAVPTDSLDSFVHRKRQEGLPGFGLMHLLIAAYVRVVSQKPGINRFLSGLRVYARNDIQVVMAVKKELSLNAPETMMKFRFRPEATVEEVYRQCTALIQEYKDSSDEENSFDRLAGILASLPRFMLSGAVRFLGWLDFYGLLPRFLTDLSPFHGSLVISSIASLGVPSVYHHLYDFGNVPMFIAFSTSRRQNELERDGTVRRVRYLDIAITTDERICDGHYYASAFHELRRYLKNPHLLEKPPEEVVEDVD